MKILITEEQMAEVFAEWLRRFKANPQEFEIDLAHISPVLNGRKDAKYFFQLAKETGMGTVTGDQTLGEIR